MSREADISPNQLEFPKYSDELVMPQENAGGFSPESRVSLVGLIRHISPSVEFGKEPTYDDYMKAEVKNIEAGLYILKSAIYQRQSLRYPHVLFLGTPSTPKAIDVESDKARVNYGVAFQPVEFKVVARNARDLGRHTKVSNREANWGNADREDDEAKSMRAAGHVLQGKIDAMDGLTTRLNEDNKSLLQLYRHLKAPQIYRIRTRILEPERAKRVEKVHETAELAAMTLQLDNRVIAGIHKAIKRKIYNGNYSSSERTANLINYFVMVGAHNTAKMSKISISRQSSQAEYDKEYRDFIEADKESQTV